MAPVLVLLAAFAASLTGVTGFVGSSFSAQCCPHASLVTAGGLAFCRRPPPLRFTAIRHAPGARRNHKLQLGEHVLHMIGQRAVYLHISLCSPSDCMLS